MPSRRDMNICLAYAAQGRTDDSGTPMRETLAGMFFALEGLAPLLDAALHHAGAKHAASTRVFLDAVRRDAAVAQGAIGLVLDRPPSARCWSTISMRRSTCARC